LLALFCAVGCDDGFTQFVFDARIVDGDDGNPAAGIDEGKLRIEIAEGDLPVRELEFDIVDGQFDATLEFASFSSVTRLRVEIDGPTTGLQTASPAFVPSATPGFLRAVAAAPSTCVEVSFNQMEAPRSEFGMVQSGTFAFVAGGAAQEGDQVEFFDALEWQSRLFTEDFSVSFLGETRVATIGEGKILVLSAEAPPFIFDMIDRSNRVTQIVLDASPQSALVSIRGVGAMVIGGESGGAPTTKVSLVEPDGSIESFDMNTPRSGAAAAAVGEDVLVVGGDEDGTAEILFTDRFEARPVAGVADRVRRGALLVSDLESRALLIGGVDGTSTLRQDTLRFDGCPSACTSSAGPSWATARSRAIVPEYSALVVGGEGARTVEEVQWSGSSVAIEPLFELQVPRAAAGAIVYESGAVVVAGGDDGQVARDDFEFCVPVELAPLESE
jgi:hypothetical protein